MKTYLKLCLWALAVLWKLKTITKVNRLRLWRKSFNLFICFLAFCDNKRPEKQLRGAMLSAILSALYDYETDWIRIENLEDSLYLELLEKYVPESPTRFSAKQLFVADWHHNLSQEGLERGSVALAFYHELIDSQWLRKYPGEKILEFGRALQIVDDLLDLQEDELEGQTNCLLLENSVQYVNEAKQFLKSDFFKTLEANSIVYHQLLLECEKRLGESEKSVPVLGQLIRSSRPHCGLFALVLTLIGFKFMGLSWLSGFFTGFGFAGITLSIMVWNDLWDRNRDCKKGKTLAFHHPLHVLSFWKNISVVTSVVLLIEGIFWWQQAVFCAVVWTLGLLYSILRFQYPWNNILVATCSGAPVLTGLVGNGIFSIKPLIVFCIIFSTIFMQETVKDIQDAKGDIGHKDTLATILGKTSATILSMLLCCLSIFFTTLYPDWRVQITSLGFLVVEITLIKSFTRPRMIYSAEKMGDLFLAVLLVVLLSIS